MKLSVKNGVLKTVFLTAAILAVTLSAIVPANAAQSGVFTDVAPGTESVEYLAKADIVIGDGNGEFRPLDNVSVKEFVTMLERAFGNPDKLPENYNDWSGWDAPWFRAGNERHPNLPDYAVEDGSLPCFLACKLLLDMRGKAAVEFHYAVKTTRYIGYALDDSTEFMLSAAVYGYVPVGDIAQYCFKSMTRLQAADLVYRALTAGE